MKPDFYDDHTVLLVVSVDAKGRVWANHCLPLEVKTEDGAALRRAVNDAVDKWKERSKRWSKK